MPYFDTSTVTGSTIRIHYEEDLGVVTITNIQLQSKTFGGGTSYAWWPGGTIKVNGEPVLTMDYRGTATHYFPVYGAGDSFIDIQAQNGVWESVSSSQIFSESTEITVDITLYRTDGRYIYDLIGSESVNLTVGLVYIDTGSGLEPALAYIDNGIDWELCIPYIDNGTEWELCT